MTRPVVVAGYPLLGLRDAPEVSSGRVSRTSGGFWETIGPALAFIPVVGPALAIAAAAYQTKRTFDKLRLQKKQIKTIKGAERAVAALEQLPTAPALRTGSTLPPVQTAGVGPLLGALALLWILK